MQDGQRRFGNPRSEAERRARHKSLYGTTKLPPRGTGLRRRRRSTRPLLAGRA